MQQASLASALNNPDTVRYTGKSCCANTDNAHDILGALLCQSRGRSLPRGTYRACAGAVAELTEGQDAEGLLNLHSDLLNGKQQKCQNPSGRNHGQAA